ncbi:MAG TPA: acylphosphatase [Patescibacteria group bacterium]
MNLARLKIVVYGNVQGVFFRQNTQEKALKLGLTGWVRNNSDGTVEIIAEGPKHKLEMLLNWCQAGSKEAWVESVSFEWISYKKEFQDFKIKCRR